MFTDNDLKRLKELLEQTNSPTQTVNNLLKIGTLLYPLLDRLEEAERCLQLPHSCVPLEENNCTACKAKIEWQEAAGK